METEVVRNSELEDRSIDMKRVDMNGKNRTEHRRRIEQGKA